MRYIIKRVGQEPEFIECDSLTPFSALCSKAHLGREFGTCDAAPLAVTKDGLGAIYVMFDDNGYFLRDVLKYNCNIPVLGYKPSESPEDNKLYGDVVFLRVSRTGEGETLNIKDEDMDLVKEYIFTAKSEAN